MDRAFHRPFVPLLLLLVMAAALSALKWPALVAYMAQRHHVSLTDEPPENRPPWPDALVRSLEETNQQMIAGLNQGLFPSALATTSPSAPHDRPTRTESLAAMASRLSERQVPQAATDNTPPATISPAPEAVGMESPKAPEAHSGPTLASLGPQKSVEPMGLATVKPLPLPVPPALSGDALTLLTQRGPVTITKEDKVLFCGDSLMQGVAPLVMNKLKRQKITVKDLSRQSTGLAYPGFFDWPKTVKAEIDGGNVTVLMMFLGANDAWDIIDHGKALRFSSEAWYRVYEQRVESIVTMAEKAGIKVVWLGLPPMEDKRLTQGAPVLNNVFQQVASRHPEVLWIPTDTTLTEDGVNYTKFKKNSAGEIMRVRADDGIHFAPAGHRLLSELIWSHLDIAL